MPRDFFFFWEVCGLDKHLEMPKSSEKNNFNTFSMTLKQFLA